MFAVPRQRPPRGVEAGVAVLGIGGPPQTTQAHSTPDPQSETGTLATHSGKIKAEFLTQ